MAVEFNSIRSGGGTLEHPVSVHYKNKPLTVMEKVGKTWSNFFHFYHKEVDPAISLVERGFHHLKVLTTDAFVGCFWGTVAGIGSSMVVATVGENIESVGRFFDSNVLVLDGLALQNNIGILAAIVTATASAAIAVKWGLRKHVKKEESIVFPILMSTIVTTSLGLKIVPQIGVILTYPVVGFISAPLSRFPWSYLNPLNAVR